MHNFNRRSAFAYTVGGILGFFKLPRACGGNGSRLSVSRISRMNTVSPDITIILPAYNEAATIVSTVTETIAYLRSRGYVYEIIVAADGNDGTRELVRELAERDTAIRAIGSPERGGKGKGIREAVAIATGTVIGFVDADNKVPIDEYDKFATKLMQGYPVVIGSRALKESQIDRKQPWYRQIGSRGFY